MNKNDYASLHSNQRFFVQELLERGIRVEIIVKELELIEARYQNHTELIVDRDGSIMPYASAIVCSDKYLTKKFLKRAGVPIAEGEQFFVDQKTDGVAYAKKLGFPIVAKPSIGSHGQHCFLDVENESELEAIFNYFATHKGKAAALLIEKQCPGMELRVLITQSGDYAIVHRDPAHVIGDGVRTIEELVNIESRRRISPRINCLCPITLDSIATKFLSRSGLHLESVPCQGAKVYLRRNSNVSQGGTCEDYTSKVHSSLIKIAHQALLAIPHLPYAGIDILSSAPEAEQTAKSCVVLEVNSNPGLHLHTRPSSGMGRNVAALIVDQLFPETKKGGQYVKRVT